MTDDKERNELGKQYEIPSEIAEEAAALRDEGDAMSPTEAYEKGFEKGFEDGKAQAEVKQAEINKAYTKTVEDLIAERDALELQLQKAKVDLKSSGAEQVKEMRAAFARIEKAARTGSRPMMSVIADTAKGFAE